MQRLLFIFVAGVCTCAIGCGLDSEATSIGALEGQCIQCHPRQVEAFEQSAHGRAAESPVFRALRARAVETMGPNPFCDRCHQPEAGAHGIEAGLSCATCHGAAGNFGTENGLLAVELGGPVRSVRDSVDPRAPHRVRASDFLSSSDLCGTCHEVRGPRGFDERPYSHWKESPAAKEGIGCPDCHLGPVAGRASEDWPMGPVANLEGLPERPVSDHRIIGLGAESEVVRALLERAVRIEVLASTGPIVRVAVENLGRGHRFPDGASFVRDIRLRLEALRADEVVQVLDERLSARGLRDGREVVSPIDADEVVETGLGPGETRTYFFKPDRTLEPDGIRVCVRFLKYRTDLLEELHLPTSLAGPTLDIACRETRLP